MDTVGYSYQSAPIWGLRIGHTTSGGSLNPVVFLNAITHAREPEGMQALFYFVHHILANYGTDPFATYLLDHRSIYLVPLVNPDGYAYNAPGGGLWRKNRDGNGIDINRNFGFRWGYDNIGSSPTSTSDIYRGPSAFSEPETRAQRDLVIALRPITGLSMHTYSDLFLHAWGYITTQTVDEAAFDEWDNLGTRWTRHPTGGSNVTLYGTNGDFNDWAYGDTISKPRAFTWTPEIGVTGDGFWPAPSRIVPIAQEMLNTFYTVSAIAGPYVQLVNHVVPEGLLNAGGIVPISLDVRNHGIAATGAGLTATLVSLDPAVTVLTGPVHYPNLASRTSGSPLSGETFYLAASDTTTPGRMVRMRCDFTTPAGFYSRDTLDLIVGTPTVLFRENGDLQVAKWFNTGTSSIATGGPSHPGPYVAMNANDRLVMKGALDLTHGTHAWALFDGTWVIHPNYNSGFEPTDFFTLVEASLDSVTWTALSGTQAVRPSDPSVTIVPGFTGTQVGWTQVWLDLSKFAGPTSNKVRLRLRTTTVSGAAGEFDLDTLRVVLYDPSNQPVPLAVGDAPGGGTLALAPPQPNPARGLTRLEYVVPRRERVTLEIFDVEGRRVATLANGVAEPGRATQSWRLVDDAGRAVGPGVYLARLRDAKTQSVRRIAIVR